MCPHHEEDDFDYTEQDRARKAAREEAAHAGYRTPMPSIKVLDKGFVRLVDSMGTDLSIVRAARVSYNADWRTGDGKDEKLIAYLWNHKHTSPFEAVTFTFEIKAPIFIFRQWHRHRTQSYNEISARYTELENEFYVPGNDVIGFQSAKNKQARVLEGDSYPDRATELSEYTATCEAAFAQYQKLLNSGWPRELARMVLPVSTYSRMFATMNLRNLLGFLDLRADSHAQWEIQRYAEALVQLAHSIVPYAMNVWQANKDIELDGLSF